MVVIMKKDASDQDIEAVITNLNAFGFDVHRSSGISQTVLGAIGVRPGFNHRILRGLNGVADVQRVTEPYKLASRIGRGMSSIIDVGGLQIGGSSIFVMAGLSNVEGEGQIKQAVAEVARSGGSLLRGNSLKSPTSFYEYHNVEEEGLKMMCQTAEAGGLQLVMEVNRTDLIEEVSKYAGMLLVRSSNMQNFGLLQALGSSGMPVMLERGLAATVEEWLMAAETIMRYGNTNIILCECGIRTFETETRTTLDLSAVSVAKIKSHLPVFVDPCQATGTRDHVIPLSRAAVAAGADGIIVDVHCDPPNASINRLQALDFNDFEQLIEQVQAVAHAIGRSIEVQVARSK